MSSTLPVLVPGIGKASLTATVENLAACAEGLRVLPAVREGNLRSPWCVLTVEDSVAEYRDSRGTSIRWHGVEPEIA